MEWRPDQDLLFELGREQLAVGLEQPVRQNLGRDQVKKVEKSELPLQPQRLRSLPENLTQLFS